VIDDSSNHDFLGDIIRYSRRVCTLIIIAAFAIYGLAWHVWTLGQSLGAIVLATMGFLLVRSLRKIAFNMTWQHFSQKSEYTELFRQLDSGILTQREASIREPVKSTSRINHKPETKQ
jgi:hypothetical protein